MIPILSVANRLSSFPVKTVIAVAIYGSGFEIGWSDLTSTSPSYRRQYPHGGECLTRHAEMHVLKKIPRFADGRQISLYVTRIKADETYGMAKPCKFCQEKLKERGILPKNIYYTWWNGEWKRMTDWTLDQIKEPCP